jgi:predicted nucleic acid-binding Zn ribbon protein
MHPFILYAQEVSRDRERRVAQLAVLQEERRARRMTSPPPEPRSMRVRRAAALGLAMTSRLMANGVRRLDECVADDLGRSLAPTE